MPSPFPGMDPYLEPHWRDVHSSLVIYIRDALQDALPPSLRARVEERVVLELPEEMSAGFFPDIRVIERRAEPYRTAQAGRPTLAEPILVDAEADPVTETFIEIIDVGSGRKVVTVIEVLSPASKTPGEAMNQYRKKQRDLCRSDSNLVEIDLLRAGKHVLAVPLEHLPAARRTPCMVCVRRAALPGKAEVYSLPLDQPLPPVKIPLRQADDDVVLDLQPLIEQCYRRGGYEGDLDYNREPVPPFTDAEAAWADRLLRQAGVRTAPAVTRQVRRKRPPRPSGD